MAVHTLQTYITKTAIVHRMKMDDTKFSNHEKQVTDNLHIVRNDWFFMSHPAPVVQSLCHKHNNS